MRLISVTLLALLIAGCAAETPLATGEDGADDGALVALDERCRLVPDPGPCRAAMPRFYYDAGRGSCERFAWGGCEGVVPFETADECEALCGR